MKVSYTWVLLQSNKLEKDDGTVERRIEYHNEEQNARNQLQIHRIFDVTVVESFPMLKVDV